MSYSMSVIISFLISIILICRAIAVTITGSQQFTNVQDAIISQVDDAYRQDNSIIVARSLTKITGPELYKMLKTRQIKYYVVLAQMNSISQDMDINSVAHIGSGKIYRGTDEEEEQLRTLITRYGGSTFYMVEIDKYRNTAIFILNYNINGNYKIGD